MLTVLEQAHWLKKTDGEVGIEIEAEGDNLWFDDLYHWRMDHDGSLRGERPIEYILKKPVERDKVGKVLDYLKNKWEDKGSVIDDSPRTSVHVHINVQDLNVKQLLSFMICYWIMEDLFVHWCGPEREGNLFCLRSRDADYMFDQLEIFLDIKDWNVLSNRNIRYSSLNMCSIPKYGSVEFRSLRGTDDISVIKDWVDMLLHLKDKSIQFENPSDILRTFSMQGSHRFVENIMGPWAEQLEMPNMDAICRENMWRVQPIAFKNLSNWEDNNKKKKRKGPNPLPKWALIKMNANPRGFLEDFVVPIPGEEIEEFKPVDEDHFL